MAIKVLLPSDGSESALVAAEYAASLMKMIPCMELTILVISDVQAKGEEIVNRTKEIFDRDQLPVKTVINRGEEEIGKIIAYYANNGPYDQIIMGRRGLSRLQDVFLGSVSEKVIHAAKCPVTVVPRDSKIKTCHKAGE